MTVLGYILFGCTTSSGSTDARCQRSSLVVGGIARTSQPMAVELDHIFLCVSVGGEEARALAAFGLSEGAPNVHPGQGTAYRRFFFRNGYLEEPGFDGELKGKTADFRPSLPIVLRW